MIRPLRLEKISVIDSPITLSDGVVPGTKALVESESKHNTPSLPIFDNLSNSAWGPTGV